MVFLNYLLSFLSDWFVCLKILQFESWGSPSRIFSSISDVYSYKKEFQMCNNLTVIFFPIFSVCLFDWCTLILWTMTIIKTPNYPTIASCDACNPCYIKLTTMKFGIQTPSGVQTLSHHYFTFNCNMIKHIMKN